MKFGEDFLEGARNPTLTFLFESMRPSALSSFGRNSQVIDRWLKANQEQRIFLTGARSDTEHARSIRERYEAKGYEVFFYQDCLPLCLEKTIGAFFATSGQVVNILSLAAEKSPYTAVENSLIKHLIPPDPNIPNPNILILEGNEARRLALDPSAVVGSAMICTLNQFLSDSPGCPAPWKRSQ